VPRHGVRSSPVWFNIRRRTDDAPNPVTSDSKRATSASLMIGRGFVRGADGFHFFGGRADELLKTSGQWVYPLEVELSLAHHPMVRECAVLAIEGAERLTALKAFVVLSAGSSASAQTTRLLQDHVKGRLPYTYPRIVAINRHAIGGLQASLRGIMTPAPSSKRCSGWSSSTTSTLTGARRLRAGTVSPIAGQRNGGPRELGIITAHLYSTVTRWLPRALSQ
jgi:hypothetical protein